jgi:Flp pilus assembly protein TadB
MSIVPVAASAVLAAAVAAVALNPGRRRRTPDDEHDQPATPDSGRQRRALDLHRHSPIVTPASLAGWADELARSLRHGSTLRVSLLSVLPDHEALHERSAPLRHRLERGAGVADACDWWADEINAGSVGGGAPLAAFAAMVGAAAHLGGSVSTPLERFAVVMRQRVSDDLERGAQSAQAKMSARVLTTVPLAVLVLLLITDADVRSVLTEPAGAGVVAIGLALNAIGGWWMRRIVGALAPGDR